MKKILAIVLSAVIMLSCVTPAFAADLGIFSDVDVTSDEGIAILTLYVEGIVQGYGDGTFGVDKPLTRAEFARMVNLVFKYNENSASIDPALIKFTDVSADDWFYNDVLLAVKIGFIAGFEDNTFRGNDNVTRQQVCSVINRIVKLPEASEHILIADQIDSWAEYDVRAIVDNGYMDVEAGDVFRATENITRGELALLLAQFVDDSSYTVELPGEIVEENKGNTSSGSESAPSVGGGTRNPSAGSSSGVSSSGSGSSGSGSVSGTVSSSGSSSDASQQPEPEEKPSEPVDNSEVLEYLRKVLADISEATFVGKESEMIDYITTSIEATIEAGEAGEKLTDDYVMVHFDEEVSLVRDIYNGMTDAERDAFINKIAAFDMETLAYLQEYFLE